MKTLASDLPISEELPYWDFVDGPIPHVLLTDGSLATGIEARLLDAECFDTSAINRLTLSLRTLLNSIPDRSSIQFFLSVKSDFEDLIASHEGILREDSHELITRLSKSRVSTLRNESVGGALYRPRLFIFLKIPPIERSKGGFFRTEAEFKDIALEDYEDRLSQLADGIEALSTNVSALGLRPELLSNSSQVARVYCYLNPSRSKNNLPPKILSGDKMIDSDKVGENHWLGDSSPREQIVFGDLVLSHDNFVLDSEIHKVVSLKNLPEDTVAGQLEGILRLPFHYDLIVSLFAPEQSAEMASLERRRRMAHSLASTPSGAVSDLESESRLGATEELIRELLNTGQKIFAMQMHFVIRTPIGDGAVKRLNRQGREIQNRLRSLQGAEGLEESVGAWKVFKGSMPLAPMRLERAKKMKTNNLADFLPIFGPSLGDRLPVVVFRNRLNGLFGYDAFDSDLPNYNTLVTGASGSGKSFLNNCILLQEMAKGQRIFIIDIGGSYKKLTETLGGQYLEINLSEASRINILHAVRDSNGKILIDQKVKTLVACIESMVADEEFGRIPKIDRVLLEKEIVDLYEEVALSGAMPTLSNLRERLAASNEPSLKVIAKMLYPWTGERPYGRLLDGEGILRADANICTFDLKGLEAHPDLQRVMILVLTDFILGAVETNRSTQKRIILDEAWQLLKSPSAASFMEYCVRTLRKMGSGITFITQGVEEIAASPIGSAILNNTATKFVLLQRGDSSVLARHLKLNSRELDLISSLEQKKGEFSECFLIKGDRRHVLRITPTPEEYWLATSDARDNAYLESLISEGKSTPEALEICAKLYPKGVSKREGDS